MNNQREIKFKVWDGIKMFRSFLMKDELNRTFVGPFDEDSIFLQYTGLVDKNDKKIYEGDILIDCEYPDEPISKDVVVWDIDKWTTKIWGEDGRNFNSYAIIGNIYESNELLIDKDKNEK